MGGLMSDSNCTCQEHQTLPGLPLCAWCLWEQVIDGEEVWEGVVASPEQFGLPTGTRLRLVGVLNPDYPPEDEIWTFEIWARVTRKRWRRVTSPTSYDGFHTAPLSPVDVGKAYHWMATITDQLEDGWED